MNSYKKCQGCGIELQDSQENKNGYVTNINFDICQKCFRSKNYGEFTNDLHDFYELDQIKEISYDNVIMVVDALNPYQTLITNINKFVPQEKLILAINKVDVFPKSISDEKIINWISDIAHSKKIYFNTLVLTSSIKKKNIDALSNFIENSRRNISFIGYSNVGKSSIIKSIFNSINQDVNNLITNSIGTTKNVIELDFNGTKVNDYPGLILKGNYQNIIDKTSIKKINPKKEMKIINFQLNEKQFINIGNFCFFYVNTSKNKSGYQFLFSNDIRIERRKNIDKSILKEFNKKEIEGIDKKRYDLIISGLGIITFNLDKNQKIELFLPKGIKFNLVESLYNYS